MRPGAIPERYGVHDGLQSFAAGARLAFGILMDAISVAYDGDIQMIDSSVMGSSTCGGEKVEIVAWPLAAVEHKIHALVDAEGLPVRLALTPGQASDVHGADMLLNHLAAGSIVGRQGIRRGLDQRKDRGSGRRTEYSGQIQS